MAELQRTVQRGNTLLQRKEEQLQQLENSMAEEVRRNNLEVSVLSNEFNYYKTNMFVIFSFSRLPIYTSFFYTLLTRTDVSHLT